MPGLPSAVCSLRAQLADLGDLAWLNSLPFLRENASTEETSYILGLMTYRLSVLRRPT